MASSTPQQNVNPKLDVADDDDYDDLDDVVQEFTPSSKPSLSASTSSHLSPQPVASGRPRTNTRVDGPPPGNTTTSTQLDGVPDEEDIMNSDFAKELAKGMEELMKEIGGGEASAGDGNGGAKPDGDDETAKALQAAWEAMLTEDRNGQNATSATGEKEKPAVTNDFQKTIRDGMERLRQSESQATGSTPGAGASGIPDQASLEALLSSLGEGENEGELAGFIDHMMNAILTKDILLEPLQEMSQKYPGFLENPPSPISDEDRQRYLKQQACVKKIINMFEQPGYDEKNPETATRVVDLMSEMQSYGSPPESLLGEPIPGLNFGQDGQMPDGCTVM